MALMTNLCTVQTLFRVQLVSAWTPLDVDPAVLNLEKNSLIWNPIKTHGSISSTLQKFLVSQKTSTSPDCKRKTRVRESKRASRSCQTCFFRKRKCRILISTLDDFKMDEGPVMTLVRNRTILYCLGLLSARSNGLHLQVRHNQKWREVPTYEPQQAMSN